MGTWGPGNFENDTAANYLIKLCKPLIEQIEVTVNNPELMDPDEYDSDIMMCNLEIIACLAEHLERYEKGAIAEFLFPTIFPPPNIVLEWKQKYLEIWDNNIDELEPEEDYKKIRREVIIKTFDRILKLSE